MTALVDSGGSMRVLHAAVFAQRQALAGGLQLFGALGRFFAGLQAFGRRLVGLGHGAVSGNVFLDFFGAVLGQSRPRQAHGGKKKGNFFHGFSSGDGLCGDKLQIGHRLISGA
jgi:hypothetical protein